MASRAWLGLRALLMILPGCLGQNLYFLGDSLLDTGNNGVLKSLNIDQPFCDLPPYGRSFVPPQVTGRCSNGKVYTDFVAEKAGVSTPPPSLKAGADLSKGANFATQGGTFYMNNISLSQYNIDQQIQDLIKAAQGGPASLAQALITIFVGANDALLWFSNNPYTFFSSSSNNLANGMAGAMVSVIRRLYNAGFRNFVVANLPMLGCIPYVRFNTYRFSKKCWGPANGIAKNVNKRTEPALLNLVKTLPGSRLVIVDTYNALAQAAKLGGIAMDSPACCGGPLPTNGLLQCYLPNATQCASTSSALWWDPFHPTQETVKRVFDLTWSGNSQYVRPYNLSTLYRLMGM